MKILLISKYAATPESGNPSRQYFFARELADLGHEVLLVNSVSNGVYKAKKRRAQFSVFSYQKGGKLEVLTLPGPSIELGMNLKRVWSWFLFEFQLWSRTGFFRKFSPDVVLVSSLSFLSFVNGMRLKRKLGIPLVVEVRDIYPLTLVEIGGWSQRNPLVRIMESIEKKAYEQASLIVSSLENAQDHVERQIGRKVRFLWLPMGMPDGLYVPVGSGPRVPNKPGQVRGDGDLDLAKQKDDGRFLVGYAGAIGGANALEDLFAIVNDPEIVEAGIQFVFWGSGSKRAEYETKYGSDRVRFFDAVPKVELPGMLQQCDLLFNAWLDRSIYSFGISPNKWIDYMYSGRPILLALNAKSNIFENADWGWQIPAENSFELKEELLKIRNLPDEELTKKGFNGREYLMNHMKYANLAQKLEKELEKIIK